LSDTGIPNHLSGGNDNLYVYGGAPIRHYGAFKMPCQYKDSTWEEFTFYVADLEGPVLFGYPLCTALGLVTINCEKDHSVMEVSQKMNAPIQNVSDLATQYPDRFEGLGKFKGKQVLHFQHDAKPSIHPPRRVPIQLRDKIKEELDRMLSLDVIRPITEPTDWVSSITYVTKADGSLRVCLDPKDLNNALKRGQHYTPTVEEISHKFSGARVFSKLDAKSGYWAVQLDDDSQLCTTFNTPFGRFCFKRLPFGLKISQDVFQAAMDVILEGLPGVISIADDIAVIGKDKEEHDANLHALMKRARERGLIFNKKKCHINVKEIMFFGNIYSDGGMRPDPMKVQAIQDIKVPENVQQLQSFLGLMTHLSP
jgi:hypothetical protein